MNFGKLTFKVVALILLTGNLGIAGCGGSEGDGDGGGGDTSAPSVPAGLTAIAVSSTRVELSWSPSTDNVGVAGYKLFRNGGEIADVQATSHADVDLTMRMTYCYRIAAYDAAGNVSESSDERCATTPPTITDTTWQPGVSIGPVDIGATFTAVQAELGPPDHTVYRTDSSGNETQAVYDFLGMSIFFPDDDSDGLLDESETVDSIVLGPVPSGGSTIPYSFRYLGLGLGSSHPEVLSAMGTPWIDNTDYSFYLGGVMFFYDNAGAVQMFVVSAPTRTPAPVAARFLRLTGALAKP